MEACKSTLEVRARLGQNSWYWCVYDGGEVVRSFIRRLDAVCWAGEIRRDRNR